VDWTKFRSYEPQSRIEALAFLQERDVLPLRNSTKEVKNMKTAAEVCRDLVDSFKDGDLVPIAFWNKILQDAKKVVATAEESGELERLLRPGDQLDTGLTFRGHKILLEITDRWSGHAASTRYREGVVREQFVRKIVSCFPELSK